ncbi:MAG TPA: FUSC family protein [Planctomycetota bacterium]|nr:FUSC family protein [Planctomycetota bacterium]
MSEVASSPPAAAPPGRLAALLGTRTSPPVGVSYAVRTSLAAAIGYASRHVVGEHLAMWTVISAVVVIQPEHRASASAAVQRVIANVLGAVVGAAAAVLIPIHPIVALVAGLCVVAALCRALGMDVAARSASVCVVIVLLRDPGGVLGSSETRVAGVLLGCAVALAVTLAAVGVERLVALRRAGGSAARGPARPAPTGRATG